MFAKLSLRNVKRSYKDYAVYFLTIIVAVSLFYVFNALSQKDALGRVMHLKNADIAKAINMVMTFLSIFISLILGFLLIYANNYLIRRRKKEMGIYLTLGMSRRKVSGLLFLETCVIGLVSLIIGLIVGVFLSQGFAALIQRLALGNLQVSIRFIFSTAAGIKTILYFAAMFLCVMIFNTVVIGRYRVIELIRGERKNQRIRHWPSYCYLIVLACSVTLIGRGYWLINYYGLHTVSKEMGYAILFGMIGTFLFFLSLAGFALKFMSISKNVYFRHLNMFVMRQISSKMNTAWISISLVTLLLFFSITGLAIGVNLSKSLNAATDQVAAFDVSIRGKGTLDGLKQQLEQKRINPDDYSRHLNAFMLYGSPLKLSDFLPYTNQSQRKSMDQLYDTHAPIPAMKLSDYNQLMRVQGKRPIHLTAHQWKLITPDLGVVKQLNPPSSLKKITFWNKGRVQQTTIENSVSTSYALGVVVPDHEVLGMKPFYSIINFNFEGNKTKQLADLQKKTKALEEPTAETRVLTRAFIADTILGNNLMVNFAILYLGLIFLIAGCAILALQQLAESADNVHRYSVLKQLGASRKIIHQALFTQIAIYFFIPLSVAMIHAFVGLKAMDAQNEAISSSESIWKTAYVVIPILLVIYLAYFIVTYFNSKSIVNKNARKA
ncbi:ABC transporter permease [Sporolactobacillus shoreicorticis]|uniref:FtsX-like permease family protein n=1 Tax=Sporolactobacillus shoreicorticis TaxID=1923877 RepID=A0ABW5S2S3_9BACL|nr:ABC transporter permease [Sporolactobacillus shoreicorticis]MCO7126480.1 ABC transporter permease [Sporolactobacillus shoreicorticis]